MKKLLTALAILMIVMTNCWAETVPSQETVSATTAANQLLEEQRIREEKEALMKSVRQTLEETLKNESGKTNDPWRKFLLSQMPEKLQINPEIGLITFSVPSWDPDVENLAGGEESWLMQVWRSVHTKTVDASVTYEMEEDGTIRIKDGLKEFIKEIGTAASAADNRFDLTQVRKAVVARLLPETLYDEEGNPTAAFSELIKAYAGEFTQAQLEAALSAQKNASMDVSKGPNALRLVYYSGNTSKLADDALVEAETVLSATDLANAMSEDEIALYYAHAFAAEAESFRNSSTKGTKQRLSFDLVKVMTESIRMEDFEQYVLEATKDFNDNLESLVEKVRQMPDYPKRDQPESGVLFEETDENSGTLLILTAEDDGKGRYILMKDELGHTVLTAFLRSGETLRAYALPGNYTIFCAKGVDWYGTVCMFREDGEYAATAETVTVLDDTHYHTISFGAEDGVGIREAEIEEFA